MTESNSTPSSVNSSKSKGTVCFVGLGTSASQTVQALAEQSSYPEIQYYAIDTGDQYAVESKDCNLDIVNLPIPDENKSLPDDLSAAPNGDDIFKNLSEIFSEYEAVFILANIGRPTGSALAKMFGTIAEHSHIPFYGIMALPLSMEGSARKKLADSTVHNIRALYSQLILIPSQVCFQSLLPRPKTPSDFFPVIHSRYSVFHSMIGSIIQGPDYFPIRVDEFQDLMDKGENGHSLLFTSGVAGHEEFSDLLQDLKNNSQIKNWNHCYSASDVFLFCHANSDLSCEHIDLLVEVVDQLFPNSQIVVGASSQIHLSPAQPCDSFQITLMTFHQAGAPAIEDSGFEDPSNSVVSDIHAEDPNDWVDDGVTTPRYQTLEDSVVSPMESGIATHPTIPEPDFSNIEKNSYIAPAPDLNEDLKKEILDQKKRSGRRREAKKIEQIQEQLPLAIVSRGRFEGLEESLYEGQDLDIPTFIRKGIDIR